MKTVDVLACWTTCGLESNVKVKYVTQAKLSAGRRDGVAGHDLSHTRHVIQVTDTALVRRSESMVSCNVSEEKYTAWEYR